MLRHGPFNFIVVKLIIALLFSYFPSSTVCYLLMWSVTYMIRHASVRLFCVRFTTKCFYINRIPLLIASSNFWIIYDLNSVFFLNDFCCRLQTNNDLLMLAIWHFNFRKRTFENSTLYEENFKPHGNGGLFFLGMVQLLWK